MIRVPEKEEILAEIELIKRSPLFRRSADVGLPILAHTVKHSLPDGDPEMLAEKEVRKAVYQDDHSDSVTTPKVSAAMGRLQLALMNYYNTEGKENPIRISYPHEGYRAVFQYAKESIPRRKPKQQRVHLKRERLPNPPPLWRRQMCKILSIRHPLPASRCTTPFRPRRPLTSR